MPNKQKCRYPTMEALKEAYDSGELSRDCKMILDNDMSYVFDGDSDDAVKVWNGRGYATGEDLGEALTLLGIPWEYC